MKIRLTLALLFLGVTSLAQARDTIVNISLADVLNLPEAHEKLDGSVKFFLSGQQTPHVLKSMITDVANEKTNGFNKSDEFGCQWAALSALIHLQQVAKQQGANAVVDIVSYYKKNETKNASTIECHAGALIKGVALKGTIAQIGE